ncbi:MAG: hypothetical protein IPM52_03845 [Bacteroidetes bacterium]|nr:hypothetical protein [Bacteroidota bacterium]
MRQIAVILLLLQSAFAQQPVWLVKSNYPNRPEAVSLAYHNNLLYRADVADTGGTAAMDAIILRRFNLSGDNDLQTRITGLASKVALLANQSGVIVAGYFKSLQSRPIILPDGQTLSTGSSPNGLLLIRFNHELQMLAYRFYPAPITPETSTVLHAQTSGIWAVLPAGTQPYNLVKFNSELDIIAGFVHDAPVTSLAGDAEGNLYVAGSCAPASTNFNDVNVSFGDVYNGYVVRYNPQLQYVWHKTMTDITCSHPNVVEHQGILWYAVSVFGGSYSIDNQTISLSGNDVLIARFVSQTGNLLHFGRLNQSQAAGMILTDRADFLSTTDQGMLLLSGSFSGQVSWPGGFQSSSYNVNYRKPFAALLAGGDVVSLFHADSVFGNSNVFSKAVDLGGGQMAVAGRGSSYVHFSPFAPISQPYASIMLINYGITGLSGKLNEPKVKARMEGRELHIEGTNCSDGMLIELSDLAGRSMMQMQTHSFRMGLSPQIKTGVYILSIKSLDDRFPMLRKKVFLP